MSYYNPAPAAPPKKDNKKIIIIIVVAVVVICCCLTALIGGYLAYSKGYLDSIMARLFGGSDPVAAVMPPETDVYISMDFLKLIVNSDYDDIINAFAEAADNPDIRSKQDIIDQIDDSLDNSMGITMTDDIFPWIGTYVGIGFLDVTMTEYGSPDMEDYLVVIQARDQPAADEFIQKMISEIEDQTGESFDTSEYQGVTIYEMDADYQQNAFARSKDVVFISTTADNIQKGIDAQKEEALANSQDFKSAMSTLNQEHVMLAYFSSNFMSEMSNMDTGSTFGMASLDFVRTAGLSLSVVEQGLMLDMVTQYNLDQLSDEQKALLSQRQGSLDNARYFPEGTQLFITGANLNKGWNFYRDMIIESLGSESDFDDSMDMFADQAGFNPDTDLFPLLDGSFALGFYTDDNSFLNQSADIPLGYLGVFETSQPAEVQSLVDDMIDNLEDQMGVNVDNSSSGDLNMNEFEVANQAIGSVGVGGNYLYLGTNSDAVEQASEKNGALADDARFKDVWSAFPNSLTPVLYADLSEMIDMLETISSEDLGVLSPIDALALATGNLNGDIVSSSMLLVINK